MMTENTLSAGLAVLALALPLSAAWAEPALAEPALAEPGASMENGRDVPPRLWAEHMAKIGPLRDQLWAKKMEYEGLIRGGAFNLPEARNILAEMLKLKEKIRAERLDLAKRMEAKGFGEGYARRGGPWLNQPRLNQPRLNRPWAGRPDNGGRGWNRHGWGSRGWDGRGGDGYWGRHHGRGGGFHGDCHGGWGG